MRNIFDFGLEDVKDEINSNQTTVNKKTEEEAKNLYDKYKDYSQQELVNEFLSTSKQKLQTGELSQEKISKTVESLSPFLNQTQKDFLNNLIGKLND